MRQRIAFILLLALAITSGAFRLKNRGSKAEQLLDNRAHRPAPFEAHISDDTISSLPARRVPEITLVSSGPGWEHVGELWKVCGIFLEYHEAANGYFIGSFQNDLLKKGNDGWWSQGSVAEGQCIHKQMPYLRVGMKLQDLHGVLGESDPKPKQLHFTYVFPIAHFDGRDGTWKAKIGQLPEDDEDGRCCLADRVEHRCMRWHGFGHCLVMVYWKSASEACPCGLVDAKTAFDAMNFRETFKQFDNSITSSEDKRLRLDVDAEFTLFPGQKGSRMAGFRVKHLPKDYESTKEKSWLAKRKGVEQSFQAAPQMTLNVVRRLLYRYVNSYSRLQIYWSNCQVFAGWFIHALLQDPSQNLPYQSWFFTPVTDVNISGVIEGNANAGNFRPGGVDGAAFEDLRVDDGFTEVDSELPPQIPLEMQSDQSAWALGD